MQTWLVVLAVVWGVLLFGGFILGASDPQKRRRMPLWTRLGSSAVLVIAAWSWLAYRPGAYTLLIAVGISLGLVGDVFMAGLAPRLPRVLSGMAAFGLGHVAYTAAFLVAAGVFGVGVAGARWAAWLAWLAVGVLGWTLIMRSGRQALRLRWPGLAYALLLANVAGLATGLALAQPAFVPAALGAVLFLASDFILAAELFREWYFPYIGDAIWLTYGPGQMLIVYTAWNLLL